MISREDIRRIIRTIGNPPMVVALDLVHLLRARLHQLDQIQEENVPVLIAESIHGIRYHAGVMKDCETVPGVLEVDVLPGRSREFLQRSRRRCDIKRHG